MKKYKKYKYCNIPEWSVVPDVPCTSRKLSQKQINCILDKFFDDLNKKLK